VSPLLVVVRSVGAGANPAIRPVHTRSLSGGGDLLKVLVIAHHGGNFAIVKTVREHFRVYFSGLRAASASERRLGS
jgi:creatinine amidohydrolase/Fe(II)-dependent formamide hydrolase-like protein